MERLLLLALGNPGDIYAFTRHNVAWMFADYVAYREKLKFRPGRGDFYVAEGGKSRFVLFKPTTYMNNSGIAAAQIVEEYGVSDLKELVVVLDDVNLPVGKMRLRLKGSDGGHNGLKSVIYHLATELFPRLRFGIGAPPEGVALRDYVLSELSDAEYETIRQGFPVAYEGLVLYLNDDINRAVQLINSWSPQNDGGSG